MKKLVVMAMVIVLSLGVLGACNTSGGNDNNSSTSNNASNNDNNNTANSNNTTQQSSRTPAETVMLFAAYCTARDSNGLRDTLYNADEYKLDSEDYTLVSRTIKVQNPSAQMEPYEIEYYQDEIKDLLDTAIVCAEVTSVFTNTKTKQQEEFVSYLDYYLISTSSHPEWMIITWANQAGY